MRVLRGERVVVRPAQPADVDRLTEIFAEPTVARWWRSGDGKQAAAEFVEGLRRFASLPATSSTSVATTGS